MAEKEKTYADSELSEFFRSYMIYHKMNPDNVLDYTEINVALSSALQKTVDIHPPKTGISVHFSDSFILMALQI